MIVMKIARIQFVLLFCVAFARRTSCGLAAEAHGVIHRRLELVKRTQARDIAEKICTSRHCCSSAERLRRPCRVLSYNRACKDDAEVFGHSDCAGVDSAYY